MLQRKDNLKEGMEQMQVLLDRSLALMNSGKDEGMMMRWQSPNLDNLAYKLVAMLFGDGAWSLTAGQAIQAPSRQQIKTFLIPFCTLWWELLLSQEDCNIPWRECRISGFRAPEKRTMKGKITTSNLYEWY